MALDLAQWERTLHLPSSPYPAMREAERREEKKTKLHYYNIIILLGVRLTTSKLAVLHSGRQRQGNTRGRHNEAVVMCTKTVLINMSLPMSQNGFNMLQFKSHSKTSKDIFVDFFVL